MLRTNAAVLAGVLFSLGMAGCIGGTSLGPNDGAMLDCVWSTADARAVKEKLEAEHESMVATGPVWADCVHGHDGCGVPHLDRLKAVLRDPAQIDIGAYVSLLDDPDIQDIWTVSMSVTWSDWPVNRPSAGGVEAPSTYDGPGDRYPDPWRQHQDAPDQADIAMLYSTGRPWSGDDFPREGYYQGTLQLEIRHQLTGSEPNILCEDASKIPLVLYIGK